MLVVLLCFLFMMILKSIRENLDYNTTISTHLSSVSVKESIGL
jgi:hypothetical protein